MKITEYSVKQIEIETESGEGIEAIFSRSRKKWSAPRLTVIYYDWSWTSRQWTFPESEAWGPAQSEAFFHYIFNSSNSYLASALDPYAVKDCDGNTDQKTLYDHILPLIKEAMKIIIAKKT